MLSDKDLYFVKQRRFVAASSFGFVDGEEYSSGKEFG
jgi:hypothetical protein